MWHVFPQMASDGDPSTGQASRCPRRVPSVRYRRLEGVGYLVRRETCLELDPVGWRIWLLSDGRTPLSDIMRALTREFDTPDPARVEKDCEAFLGHLADQGFLVWQ